MNTDDIVAIQQIVALYGHAADAPEENLLPLVFTEDAVWEAPGGPSHSDNLRWEGIAQIKAMFDKGVPPNSPGHHSTNVWVREENGQVLVRSKFIAHPEQNPGPWFGDYNDVVVKTADGWRIKHRVVRFRYPRNEKVR